MYCPECENIQVVKAVDPSKVSSGRAFRGHPRARVWTINIYPDIQWFRRGRECTVCGHQFVTVEIEDIYLNELIERRRRDLVVDDSVCSVACPSQQGVLLERLNHVAMVKWNGDEKPTLHAIEDLKEVRG